jgi:hypothetical protein
VILWVPGEVLVEAVTKIKYPVLDFSHLYGPGA